jgi:hypothetical protein
MKVVTPSGGQKLFHMDCCHSTALTYLFDQVLLDFLRIFREFRRCNWPLPAPRAGKSAPVLQNLRQALGRGRLTTNWNEKAR